MNISPDKTIPAPESARPATWARADDFVMPATPCQTRFWLLHTMYPGSHSLNMPIAWTCRGTLSPAVAATALTELVRRHESLRTTFEVVDGQLSQVIHSPFEVPLPVEDLRHMPKDARQRDADSIIRQQARIPMDMAKGPLFIARAVQLADDEHILLITIHHSVCDGWSNGVVLRDFSAIYDGLMRSLPPGLPEFSSAISQSGSSSGERERSRRSLWNTGAEPWKETLSRFESSGTFLAAESKNRGISKLFCWLRTWCGRRGTSVRPGG